MPVAACFQKIQCWQQAFHKNHPMKKILVVISFTTAFHMAFAQNAVIKISGTRIAYPLFQEWITEYSKSHKGISFIINSSKPADSSDKAIASYAVPPENIKAGKQLIAVSRYVQLPIVNSSRKDLSALQQKGFTEQAFRQVYFNDPGNNKPDRFTNLFTVYTRERPVCATKAFTTHFGRQANDIHGVGVAGDDRTLLDAVKKDINAISYNNLGFIYNLQTRKVNDSIAVIPIDLNENGTIDAAERIYNTVDDVVTFAEKTNSSKLPIANVNVIVNKEGSDAVKDFLRWVLQYGQQYNQAIGFLKLPESLLEDQSAILAVQHDSNDLDAAYGKQN